MFGLLKSSFVWQFAGGFVLGTIGLALLHPTEAGAAPIAAPVIVAP